MTWSYSVSSLGLAKNQVRLIIGDTATSDQQLADEEITYVLGVQTTVTYAAASCCDLIAAKYARKVNTQNGLLRVSAAAQHEHYLKLAEKLRTGGPGTIPGENGGTTLADMYVGGAKVSQKQALEGDSDLVGPSFAVGMDDYEDSSVRDNTLPED